MAFLWIVHIVTKLEFGRHIKDPVPLILNPSDCGYERGHFCNFIFVGCCTNAIWRWQVENNSSLENYFLTQINKESDLYFTTNLWNIFCTFPFFARISNSIKLNIPNTVTCSVIQQTVLCYFNLVSFKTKKQAAE